MFNNRQQRSISKVEEKREPTSPHGESGRQEMEEKNGWVWIYIVVQNPNTFWAVVLTRLRFRHCLMAQPKMLLDLT